MKPIKALKTSIFLLLLVLISTVTTSAGNGDKNIIRINPAYKINRVSNGSVIVTSKDGDASVKHEFSDFYADLLMAAYRKQSMGMITDTLKKKYYMSEDECRRELKHAINTLSEWKIILRDDDLALH